MSLRLIIGSRDLAWQDRANCAGTDGERFFPEAGGNGHDVKKICNRCDVKQECLEYALAHNEVGFWGGTSEHERREMLRKRTRGGPVSPNLRRVRSGIAEHHHVIVDMLSRDKPATWAEIAAAIGYGTDAVKAYWHRQKKAVAS